MKQSPGRPKGKLVNPVVAGTCGERQVKALVPNDLHTSGKLNAKSANQQVYVDVDLVHRSGQYVTLIREITCNYRMARGI